MNFLAHYVLATRYLPSAEPLPLYVAGTALPDLLPLASSRSRLRLAAATAMPALSAEDAALRAGALAHLATDAAFHNTRAFADAQAEAKSLLQQTPLDGIRVRGFFVAHVLVELALDAALLRANPAIADDFYAVFNDANYATVTRWAERAVGVPLPALPAVLTRFARSRYLYSYGEDGGVATGLSRVCGRARQDTFAGKNYQRLVGVVGETVQTLAGRVDAMLAETALRLQPPTTPK